ncbi:MAG: protein kinase [Planctomycetes bacterium]|nr:protein kinase [Planctomycetota bacterium]
MPLVTCPRCHALLGDRPALADAPPLQCPQCGSEIRPAAEDLTAVPARGSTPPPQETVQPTRPRSSSPALAEPSSTKVWTGPFDFGGNAPQARNVRIGPYRLVREVGRGGMGIVYEAEDEALGRRVALKLLPPAYGLTPEFVERFHREASAAARLEHPNIARVLRVDEYHGTHYYVMDFIEGVTLSSLLHAKAKEPQADADALAAGITPVAEASSGAPGTPAPPPAPLPLLRGGAYVREAARLIAEVAGALAEAHAKGMVHRDIKPSNLIYQSRGRLILTDFGLVKMAGSQALTASGDVLGTPAYMSPEQASGREIDARTDVYSLGVTLYEMVTLRWPFLSADASELTRMILAAEPPDPVKLNPACPSDLGTILLKTLEKDPARRYADAAAFRADLERFLAGESVQARPLEPLHKTIRGVLHLPLRYGYGPCSMLASVASVGVGLVYLLLSTLSLRWFPSEPVLQAFFLLGLAVGGAAAYEGVALGVFALRVRGEAAPLAGGGLLLNAFLLVLANLLVLHYGVYGDRRMIRVEGYSLLAEEDVPSWRGFAAWLGTAEKTGQHSPAFRTRLLLGPDGERAVSAVADAPDADPGRRSEALAALEALNAVLGRRDYHLATSWPGLEASPAWEKLSPLVARGSSELSRDELLRRNRLLLEAGCPEVKRSSEVPWGPFYSTLIERWGPRGGSRWCLAAAAFVLALAWAALLRGFDPRAGRRLLAAALLFLVLKAVDDAWLNAGRTLFEVTWTPVGAARSVGAYLALVWANALVAAGAAAALPDLRPAMRRLFLPTSAALALALLATVAARLASAS